MAKNSKIIRMRKNKLRNYFLAKQFAKKEEVWQLEI